MSIRDCVYTTPSHQYPLGGILPIQRRQALLAFAEKAGCFVVEDDYDSEFRYEGRPVSSLYDLNPQRVIYLGSFSKVLAPALRLGFAILPESLVQHWKPEKMYHDVHSDSLSQHALAEFIRKGELEKHIWKARKLYKRKREALISALSSRFGSRFEIMGQAAGLHLVASFTNKVITDEIVQSLYDAGVRVRPVTRYCLESQSEHQSEVILGYSHLRFDQIERGVDILSRVLR